MRCLHHDLAVGQDGACVLCRRESMHERPAQGRWHGKVWMAVLIAAAAIALRVATVGRRTSSLGGMGAAPSAAASAPVAAIAGTLKTTNAAGRTGAFYLPTAYTSAPLPLLVAIHGTGGNGAGIVNLFRGAAEKEHFIVVAPDSRIAPNGQPSWEVPDHPGDTTEDRGHIRACLDEVLAMPGVRVNPERTLIAGHSGGGSTAPYVASVDEFYKAFAVLHGGVFAGGLGPERVRGWFSTGTGDTLRTPAMVRDAVNAARRAGFGAIVYREFQGGHEVGAEELRALLQWWLER